MRNLKFIRALLIAATFAFAGGAVQAQEQFKTVDITGQQTLGEYGDPANSFIELNVGAAAEITSIAWDFTVTAFDPSWLSEFQIHFSSSAGFDGVVFTPSDVTDFGTESFSGSANLTDLGLNFFVGDDGILRIEFAEGWKDLDIGVADANVDFGTLTVGYVSAVPEPSTYAMMLLGLAAVGAVARRRQGK